MKRIVITGANRGIGLALVEHVLTAADNHMVWLGARNPERGQAAAQPLMSTTEKVSGEPAFPKKLFLSLIATLASSRHQRPPAGVAGSV